MLQANPSLTLAQIQSAMDTTATSFGTPAPNFKTGYGLLNADAAMNSLSPAVLPSGDIAVNVTVSPTSVIPSAALTYTVTVTNNGPNDAQTVTLTDAVPANTTFVSDSNVAGWANTHPAAGATGTVTYTTAALAPGASSTFTIRVQIDGAFAAGVISDTATVGASPADINLTNNSKTVTATVAAGAALLPDPANPAIWSSAALPPPTPSCSSRAMAASWLPTSMEPCWATSIPRAGSWPTARRRTTIFPSVRRSPCPRSFTAARATTR
jgi:uncharacterized repeat protein (TIGR01451 family)